jgi:abnormal spindle-like microcephaly-associated protein
MKKFFSLILLLDVTKTRKVLLLPTLFVRDTPIKTSKEIILSFSRNMMKGEGDIVRHVGLFGYSLSFSQSYIDEFSYPVENLAVDLRDGVRLARLVELLSSSQDLSESLRVPAVSRLQKLHNVGLVLKKVYGVGKSLSTQPNSQSVSDDSIMIVSEAKNIVDGDRDKTLYILWKILYKFESRMPLDPTKILLEVASIEGNKGWRKSIYSEEEALTLAVRVNMKISEVRGRSESGEGPDNLAVAGALLKWVDAIASQYGKMSNHNSNSNTYIRIIAF